MDGILGEVTIRHRRKKLEQITQGNRLSDAYTTTLTRLKAQKGNKSVLGMKVLMWVLYSEWPLQSEELCHALGVEIGSTDLDPEGVPALRTLLSSCLGLVTVEASSSTVRLVHFTLQEHLLHDPTLFHIPHSTIAEVCLTYLNFESVWDLPQTLDSAPSTMPFLEYASYHWGEHTRRGATENVKRLARRLLDRFDEHISAQLLLIYRRPFRLYFDQPGGPTGFTGLHGAAFLGIAEIVAAILETKECDVNATDCIGHTALVWAAIEGHEEVVRRLLDQEGINPDHVHTRSGPSGRTPLSWAAESGYEGIVKMLLERGDVNPNHTDTDQTPLWQAVWNDHEGTSKLVFERKDVNPDQADTGQTPLWNAA